MHRLFIALPYALRLGPVQETCLGLSPGSVQMPARISLLFGTLLAILDQKRGGPDLLSFEVQLARQIVNNEPILAFHCP